MWRFALVCIAACAPTWTHASYRPTALADARRAASLDHACPEGNIRFKRDATVWGAMLVDGDQIVYEPGGVVGTVMERAPRWTFVFDVCGEQHVYVRPVTDAPDRDPAFYDLDAPTPNPTWRDL
ncbi:MAG: hypothetical protein JO257_08680 [Deltaproteobacteria bacterium]|nr:hypothetical protein [Deltaproteobacteria bacterium]